MPLPAARFRRRRVLTAGLVATAIAAGAAAAGPAEARKERRLPVMTQNVYLGADLTPALTATTPEEFVAATTSIWQGVLATDFPRRAEALARQVDAADPRLIGLQEVTLWRSGPAFDPAPATAVEFDYLRILKRALRERGLRYRTVAVTRNADIEAPTLAGVDVRLTDRDVILARVERRGPRLRLSNVREENFDTNLTVPTPAGPLTFVRGWNSVDVKLRGSRVRFVNTHLETQVAPAIQRAQAAELLAGPLSGPRRQILVGDLNSAADGSDTPTYADLLAAGFADAWSAARPGDAGFTCCQAADLRNDTSLLDQRIDHVLTRPALRVRGARLLGEDPDDRTPGTPRLWPSDHAGVAADLVLPNPGRGRDRTGRRRGARLR